MTVNGSAAPREGPWWGQSNATTSGSSAAWLDFYIDATLGGNTEHSDMQLLVPPSSVTPTYDADGNLTGDGLRTFTWDAENRLVSVTTTDTLLPTGAPMYRVSYQYDDGGRRIAQTVETRTVSGGSYILAARRCFLYDGWNCVAEYDYVPSGGGATRTLFRSQVWGQDMGGGGAGGLLLVRRHTGPQAGTHFATHDGNGNVTALVDAATGTESARYDYDPFGNVLRASGAIAAENPYRFSSQFADNVTGLFYYGYRHYDSGHGRWLSRDPIDEEGGLNLYGFVGNDGVNSFDALGLEAVSVGGSWEAFRNIGASLKKQWNGPSNRLGVGAIAVSVAYVAWTEAYRQAQNIRLGRIACAAAAAANCAGMSQILTEAVKVANNVQMVMDAQLALSGAPVPLQEFSAQLGVALTVIEIAAANISQFCPDYAAFAEQAKTNVRDANNRLAARINQETKRRLATSTPAARARAAEAVAERLKNFENPFTSAPLTAGKNYKEHWARARDYLQKITGEKIPKWSEGGDKVVLEGYSKLIQDGVLQSAGKHTIKNLDDVVEVFRGQGITLLRNPDGSFRTV